MADYMTTPTGATTLVGWDCRANYSNPTVNGSTGVMSAAGSDSWLANGSTGATYNIVNTPRACVVTNGMLCPFYNEVLTGSNSFAGMEAVLPAGSWVANRLLTVMAIAPLSLSSVASQGNARLFTTDAAVGSGPFVSMQKYLKLSTATQHGVLAVRSSGGTDRDTVGFNGIEPHVVAFYKASTDNLAYGYANVVGSRNAIGAGAGSSAAISRIVYGLCTNASNALNQNGPFYGIILAVRTYGRTAASGTDFTQAEAVTAMDEMRAAWSTYIPVASPTTGVCIIGDSKAYTSASQNDDQLTTNAGKRTTTLTGSHAAGVSTINVAASASITDGRYTIDPGTVNAETVTVNGRPTGTSITISNAGGTRIAHTGGENIVNDYFGWMNPLLGWPQANKKFGLASGAGIANCALPGTQLQTEAARTATTVGSSTSIGATTIDLTSASGFTANECIILSAGTANQEVVKITSVASNTLTVPAMAYAHTAGDVVLHDGDGSMQGLNRYTKGVYVIQRFRNDIVAGTRTGAQGQADARTMATRARQAGADFVIAMKVPPDVGITTGTLEGYRGTYNGFLDTDAALGGAYWDAVVSIHWLHGKDTTMSAGELAVAPCTNPASITYSGSYGTATAATAISGALFDASGIHERAFLNACWALMVDKAFATATLGTTGYAPAAPVATGAIRGNTTVITWSTPSSPSAPTIGGTTNEGPSGILAVVRRNGSVIAVVAPATINTITGAVTYTTTYTYSGVGGTYTVEHVDAAGNTNGQVNVSIPLGFRSRGYRNRLLVRP